MAAMGMEMKQRLVHGRREGKGNGRYEELVLQQKRSAEKWKGHGQNNKHAMSLTEILRGLTTPWASFPW